ncbi:MAG: hypothetical protein FRX48_00036 [Lasallia pustulata]|uniref:Asl1-like glycosyl hydrolase catalytic domain-containing protein n=1 Tax=Lasallia pustulata TaxID=136370 RepID=A0A5M8Q2U3_9LECA|nr:MAG: hypothetical protein FRX48_00036 [Lasallia pustulata]
MSCAYSPAVTSSYTSSLPSSAAASSIFYSNPSSTSIGSFTSSFTSTFTSSITSSSTSTLPSSAAPVIPSTFSTITTSSSTTTPSPGSTSVPPLQPLPAGSPKCPPNFRNSVFNTVASQDSGWPLRWSTISGMGVSNWIGFTQDSISNTPSYNNAPCTPAIDSAQIKICMDPTKVSAALTLITGPSPPTYLELFNEPDFSYEGYTPLTDPVSAANALAPIFNATTTTQFLSPAVAYTNSDWLTTFAANCNNCMDKIPIISAHVYAPDPATALNQVATLHATWPSKRIWITELAPASSNSQGCTLDANGVINWMQTVVPYLAQSGYVDRIFWNTGEHSTMSPCNPSLTNSDGTATPLLQAYASVCG